MRITSALIAIFVLVTSLIAAEPFTREQVVERMKPYTGPTVHKAHPDSLKGKVMCGYQGWFAAKDDGSQRGWFHYGQPGHCGFDLWPDMTEMHDDEKYATEFRHKDGSTAYLFSPYNTKTVVRHFEWMKQYEIDGVFLQRFGTNVHSPASLNHCNVVMSNVQSGANQCGRTWAVMYDLSGLKKGDIERVIMTDWKLVNDRMKIRDDKAYLHHEGKPLVGVWGVGFNDNRNYTLDECEALIRFLKDDPKYGNNTVMLGIPSWWRSQTRDAISDPRLHKVIQQTDIISPWTVGRYQNPDEAKIHADQLIKPDIEWCKDKSLDYLPVIFPGFSWRNLMKTRGEDKPANQIPRLKGEFLWSQATAFKAAGAEMFYVAMFDEIDEGTAIFKCTNNPPVGESSFVTYEGLPTDHYLKLTGKIGRLVRKSRKTR